MFASRSRGATPHLAWRVRLFSGAAVLALIGMFTDQRLPIWGAIALLGAALVLRFLPASPADEVPDVDETDDAPPE